VKSKIVFPFWLLNLLRNQKHEHFETIFQQTNGLIAIAWGNAPGLIKVIKTEPCRGERIQARKNLIRLLLIEFLIGLNSPGSNVFPLKTIPNRPTAWEQQHRATPYVNTNGQNGALKGRKPSKNSSLPDPIHV
jgi:hypothetical protein